MADEKLEGRARLIKLLLMDVDGVMTDGTLYPVPDGQARQLAD